jgi:O-antigen/teichoic acid export membrane protein
VQDENLGRHSLVYTFGASLAVLGSIILLPVYTHSLSPAEYGLLETALRFVSMCILVAFVGLRQGYLRFYFDEPSVAWQKKLTSSTLFSILIVGACVLFPLFALASLLSGSLGFTDFSFGASVLLTVWLTFEAIYLIGLSFLQVRFLSLPYVCAQTARVILLVGVNYFMLAILKLGITGALLGNLLAATASGLVASILLLRWAGTRISTPTIMDLMRFGAPFIPTALFGYVLANADRLTLLHFGFAASLGLLSLASKLGEMALSVLTAPLESIWMPYAFSVHEQPDGPVKIGALFMKYVATLVFIGLLTSLAAPLIVRLLAPPEFSYASDLVPLVAIGCVFFSIATLSDIGIVIAKQTRLKPYILASTAAIAIALQLILTPRAGLVGAILGTTLTSICLYVIIDSVASRYYRFTVRSSTMLYLVLGAGFGFFAGRYVQSAFDSLAGMILSVIVGMSIYSLVVHLTRLITFGDLFALAGQFRRKSAA